MRGVRIHTNHSGLEVHKSVCSNLCIYRCAGTEVQMAWGLDFYLAFKKNLFLCVCTWTECVYL